MRETDSSEFSASRYILDELWRLIIGVYLYRCEEKFLSGWPQREFYQLICQLVSGEISENPVPTEFWKLGVK